MMVKSTLALIVISAAFFILASNTSIIFRAVDESADSFGLKSPMAIVMRQRLELQKFIASNGFQTNIKKAPVCEDLDAQKISYTFALQLSEERLWLMRYQCERWGDHPISIALFSNRTRHDVTVDLIKMGCTASQLTVNTFYDDGDYPINYLRNLAIAAVKTTHVFYADVDFLVSAELHQILSMGFVREALVEDDKLALVVPAFQIFRSGLKCKDKSKLEILKCDKRHIQRMPKDRRELETMLRQRKGFVTVFDVTNVKGHGSTDYMNWLGDKSLALRDIRCFTSNRYEPYLIFRFCGDVPPYQEAFRGYGKNKLTWIMQMRRVGYKFKVVPNGFLIHFPHKASQSRKIWDKRPKQLGRMKPDEVVGINWNQYKRGKVDALYSKFKKWLAEETADDSRTPICTNAVDDDGRLWVEHA